MDAPILAKNPPDSKAQAAIPASPPPASQDAPATSPPSSKLDAALALAAAGFCVFPLLPNSKVARIEGWPNLATTDAKQIAAWWREEPDGNIGILTSRYFVVDVDPRHGGDKTFAELCQAAEMSDDVLPPTLHAKTQGGGSHLFFLLPLGRIVNSGANKLGRGVDVKSYHSYVVGAGSSIDGRFYKWEPGFGPGEVEQAEVPAWLLGRARPPRKKSPDAGKRIVEEDADAVQLATDWLEDRCPDSVVGERDDGAYKAACRLFDFGVERETAIQLMCEVWNELHCFPPVPEEDIVEKIDNALHSRQTAIGSKHPSQAAAGFEPVVIAERVAPVAGGAAGRFLRRLEPFEVAALKPRDWIIPGFLCRKKATLTIGTAGVAKSTLGIQVALAIAAKRPDIIARPISRHGNVWLHNQEDDAEEMHLRIAAVMQRFGITWDDLRDVNGRLRLFLTSGVDTPLILAKRSPESAVVASVQVREVIADIRDFGADVAILDPLVELHEAEENSNIDMRAVLGIVRRIAVEGNCATLLVAHTRKPPGASSEGMAGEMDSLRGASSQIGVVRIATTLCAATDADKKKYRLEDNRRAYVREDDAKNNLAAMSDGPRWFRKETMSVNGEAIGVLVPVEASAAEAEAAQETRKAELLEALAEAIHKHLARGEWHSVGAVVEAAGGAAREAFADKTNRSRAVKALFGDADDAMTDFGVLKTMRRPGKLGYSLLLCKAAGGSAE